jgi:two-component system chemotaxis response regulator CheY
MALILLVDDAAFMRMKCAKLLKEAGHDVAEASNGQEALEQYQAIKPDLVFMDITMPVMDGLQAVKAIKELDPKAKIVMLSAMGQQTMVIEALKSGAADFILKPFEPARVLQAVTAQVG